MNGKCRMCIACDYIKWKKLFAHCVWEIIGIFYKRPTNYDDVYEDEEEKTT